jgi:xanthine dehydrogenase accessory factor
VKLDTLKSLNAERAARRAVLIVTDPQSGDQRLVKAAEVGTDPLKNLLESRLRSGKSGMVEIGEGRVFVTVHVPPPRLVITGAVHISQALAPMARLVGYDVTIVDPRTAFATSQRFPDVAVIADWPDVALPALNIDHYTAFVALTHDPKIDDPALIHVLERDCFYVGALGSKKTHARRLTRLKEQGVSDAALSRISAPIGLAIGAVSPAEIAVAIMAQITARLRLEREVAG